MKESEVKQYPLGQYPFGMNAQFTKSTSKHWTDEEIKKGWSQILKNNGVNNGYMTLEDLNRFGYNMAEASFAKQIGVVPMFDSEYCEAIGGYPKGARIYGLIKGALVEATSLVDDNKVDFQKVGIDDVNWKSIKFDYPFPSCTPKRKLVSLKFGSEWGSEVDFAYEAPTRSILYTADKNMWVSIDLSDFRLQSKFYKKTYNGKSGNMVSPLNFNILCYVGSADANPNEVDLSDIGNALMITGDWFRTKFSPTWTCVQYSFISPGFKSSSSDIICGITNSYVSGNTTAYYLSAPDLWFGCDNAFHMNEGDQMIVFPFYMNNAFMLSNNQGKYEIHLSEF